MWHTVVYGGTARCGVLQECGIKRTRVINRVVVLGFEFVYDLGCFVYCWSVMLCTVVYGTWCNISTKPYETSGFLSRIHYGNRGMFCLLVLLWSTKFSTTKRTSVFFRTKVVSYLGYYLLLVWKEGNILLIWYVWVCCGRPNFQQPKKQIRFFSDKVPSVGSGWGLALGIYSGVPSLRLPRDKPIQVVLSQLRSCLFITAENIPH